MIDKIKVEGTYWPQIISKVNEIIHLVNQHNDSIYGPPEMVDARDGSQLFHVPDKALGPEDFGHWENGAWVPREPPISATEVLERQEEAMTVNELKAQVKKLEGQLETVRLDRSVEVRKLNTDIQEQVDTIVELRGKLDRRDEELKRSGDLVRKQRARDACIVAKTRENNYRLELQAQGLYDALKRLANRLAGMEVVDGIHGTGKQRCGELGYMLYPWHEAKLTLEDCEELDERHRTEGGDPFP